MNPSQVKTIFSIDSEFKLISKDERKLKNYFHNCSVHV